MNCMVRNWKLLISICLSIIVLICAFLRRDEIIHAFGSLQEIKPGWLLLAFALELFGFFCASQVFHRVLSSLGYQFSRIRLWGIALVAIMLSQSVPAGGVASYAFLISTFRRKGVSAGHATLVATLETLSYASAMLLMFLFSLAYMVYRSGFDLLDIGSLSAAAAAIVVISTVVYVITRPAQQLLGVLLPLKHKFDRLRGKQCDDLWVSNIVHEIVRGRELIATQRKEVLILIGFQLLSLSVHSLAMLTVLHGLQASTSFFAVLAAFGTALITSTFNVLPGGGGTVEAVLVLVLQQFGVGDTSYLGAVIFRILNFWLLAPIAIVAYRLLMRHQLQKQAMPQFKPIKKPNVVVRPWRQRKPYLAAHRRQARRRPQVL